MKSYIVEVPITALATIEVEADSEEDAVKEAMLDVSLDHVIEWEAHEQIVRGNVFYGVQNEIEIEEI